MKYIGSYQKSGEGRWPYTAFPSVSNKMQYVIDVLTDLKKEPEIFSTALVDDTKLEKERRGFLYPSCKYISKDGTCWKTVFSFGVANKLAKKCSQAGLLIQLIFYLLFRCKRGEQLLVYHSPVLYIPLKIGKKLKGLRYILEVEELYAGTYGLKPGQAVWEKKIFELAEQYIVVSETLRKKIDKPSAVVLYGAYRAKEKQPADCDGKIHILFSGYIEYLKKGAFRAVQLMEYLPDEYVLHITGYGEEDAVCALKEEIKKAKGNCVFHGLLDADEYERVMNRCSIALNLQTMGEYTAVELPSKVLVYLSHNLRVVSTKSMSLEESRLKDVLYFVSEDLKKTAEVIRSMDLTAPYDSISLMRGLDSNFRKEFSAILGE